MNFKGPPLKSAFISESSEAKSVSLSENKWKKSILLPFPTHRKAKNTQKTTG